MWSFLWKDDWFPMEKGWQIMGGRNFLHRQQQQLKAEDRNMLWRESSILDARHHHGAYIYTDTELMLTPSPNRTGVLCIILCLALGIANIFSFSLLIIFSVICLYALPSPSPSSLSPLPSPLTASPQPRSISGLILIFLEIPLLLRICPTSPRFDQFMRRFTTNAMRAGMYGVMSLVQWFSLFLGRSSLIAAAVFLLLAAVFYLIAAVKGQEFAGSKTLGGHGVAQMIV